jgi:hypothetical protein
MLSSRDREGIAMKASMEQVQNEVDTNLACFLRQLPKLLEKHRDQYALLHRGVVTAVCASAEAAQAEGNRRYADGLFSVQKIVDVQIDLGFFSHAVHLG